MNWSPADRLITGIAALGISVLAASPLALFVGIGILAGVALDRAEDSGD